MFFVAYPEKFIRDDAVEPCFYNFPSSSYLSQYKMLARSCIRIGGLVEPEQKMWAREPRRLLKLRSLGCDVTESKADRHDASITIRCVYSALRNRQNYTVGPTAVAQSFGQRSIFCCFRRESTKLLRAKFRQQNQHQIFAKTTPWLSSPHLNFKVSTGYPNGG